MLSSLLANQFKKDILRLHTEVKSFQNEENLWKVTGTIQNSSGNLALHLVGNLNHFIGHVLGNSDYQRDRTFEFEGKNVKQSSILTDIENTIPVIVKVITALTDEDLEKEFPIQIFKNELLTAGGLLLHLTNHLNYHLGQINYLRRTLEN